MADSAARAPFPTDPADFNADDRVSFSLKSQTYLLEDERGEEWEWLSQQSKWVPMVCPESCLPLPTLAGASGRPALALRTDTCLWRAEIV